MGNIKIVANLEEIVAGGKLLELADFQGFVKVDLALGEMPETTFMLNLPGVCNYYGDPSHSNMSRPDSIIQSRLETLSGVRVPRLKGYTTVSLVLKWYQAQMYFDKATSYNFMKDHYSEYQRIVVLCKQACDLYRELVNDLLPYFVPDARNTVKFLMLRESFSSPVYKAYISLSYAMQYEVSRHLENAATTPQNLIDAWIFLTNVVVALEVENHQISLFYEDYIYQQIYQKYLYDQAQQPHSLKNILVAYFHLDPDFPPRYSHVKRIFEYSVVAIRKDLNKFLAVRASKIKQADVDQGLVNTVSHNVGSAHKFGVLFFSRICLHHIERTDEAIPLLDDSLEYTPIFIAPRHAAHNALDKDIVKMERDLIFKSQDLLLDDKPGLTSYQDLSALVAEWLKLLALVHMRYRNALVANYQAFFGLESNASVNKKHYYKIFEVYLTAHLYSILEQMLALIKSNNFIGAQENLAQAATQIIKLNELIAQLEDFINNADVAINKSCAKCESGLLGLQAKIADLEKLLTLESNPQAQPKQNLRRRLV